MTEYETYVLVKFGKCTYSLVNSKNISDKEFIIHEVNIMDAPRGKFKIQNIECISKHTNITNIKIHFREYFDTEKVCYANYYYNIIELGNGLAILRHLFSERFGSEQEPIRKKQSSCSIQ